MTKENTYTILAIILLAILFCKAETKPITEEKLKEIYSYGDFVSPGVDISDKDYHRNQPTNVVIDYVKVMKDAGWEVSGE